MECEIANLKQAVTGANKENSILTQKFANLKEELQQTANNLTLVQQVCIHSYFSEGIKAK